MLNRPLGEKFEVAEVTLDDTRMLRGGQRLGRLLKSPEHFERVHDFFVEEGLSRSPELASLAAQLNAKEREVTSNSLVPFVPRFDLQGSVTHRFLRAGVGSDIPAVPGGPDRFDMQVGVTATLPLYEGNARYARTRRSRAERRQLQLRTKATRQIVEQLVRTALHRAVASLRTIRLSRQAATLAHENLDLVSASYAQGKVGLAELLDAQTQVLSADAAATTATYDFMTDLTDLQRGMGRFEFTMSNEDIASFMQRLSSHVRGDGRRRGVAR